MLRRHFLQAFSALTLGLSLSGCGSEQASPGLNVGRPALPPSSFQFVVSASQAVDLVRAGALLLAAESIVESMPVALLGGALTVDVDALTVISEVPGAFDDLSALQRFFRDLGVREGVPVVIYDDAELRFAARVRFLLEYCGASPTVIVDGGALALQALLPAGGGTAIQSSFQARATNTPIALVFQGQVLADLVKGGSKILDVRTPAEFVGQLLLPGDARPGHIPGALNLPLGNLLGAGGVLSPDLLLAAFAAAGLASADKIIVYCHDGAKSSLVATLLVQSGFASVNLYYLSYRDWSQNPLLPVEL